MPQFLAILLGLAGFLGLFGAAPSMAGEGVFGKAAHGRTGGVGLRGALAGEGSCSDCHTSQDLQGQSRPASLTMENANNLCYSCHGTGSRLTSLGDAGAYQRSSHGFSPAATWPGPDPDPRREGDAPGKCLNCHTPHGVADAQGLIPGLLFKREAELCLTCHDGSPSRTDIAGAYRRPSVHPLTQPELAQGNRFSKPSRVHQRFSFFQLSEGACSACHNAHAARENTHTRQAPLANEPLIGAGRVTVRNGGPGSPPAYAYQGPGENPEEVKEYEVCFTCHSGWQRLPAGRGDLAILFNPENASFHPVEGPGKNRGIPPGAFSNGWTAQSLVRCSDCHGNNDLLTPGLHGSDYAPLLKAPYDLSFQRRAVERGDLCFLCHEFNVYGGDETIATLSRYNAPASPEGHLAHAVQYQVPCSGCHVSHGAPLAPFLLGRTRGEGITGFQITPTGGRCSSTCHEPKDYTINYAR